MNFRLFEGKKIVKTREQLAAVELTAQQMRAGTVWVVRESGHVAGDDKLQGWFIEMAEGDIVVCVTTLFKGEVTSDKWFPKGPAFKWDPKYKSKDPQVSSEAIFKNIVVSRMADENLLGYYDMITPVTPLVNRISGSFKWWVKGAHAPLIPFSPTNDKKEVLSRMAHFETSFAAVANPPDYALDGLFALRVLKEQLPAMRDRGVQNTSRFLTTLVKAWAMSKNPTHFSGPLSKIGYPTDKTLSVEQRAKQYHNLIIGKGNDTVRGLGFCLWNAPRITVTTDNEGFTSKTKAKTPEKKFYLDMGPDLKLETGSDADPLEGSFAESSASGASKSHIKKNSDPDFGPQFPLSKRSVPEKGKEAEMLAEEASEDTISEISNSFTAVNFRRFFRRVKRSVKAIVENVRPEGEFSKKTVPQKVRAGAIFAVSSAVKGLATVPISAVVGLWYGLKEPYIAVTSQPIPSGWKEATFHIVDCSIFAVTSIATSTVSGVFAGLATATR